MRLTPEQSTLLRRAFSDLINYNADDPTSPIDPATYRAADGDRLIHVAALRGDLGTVELLLNAGEAIDATGDMGKTPAHYAAMGQHREVFDLLMGRGANPTIVDEFGMTPVSSWDAKADEPH